MMMMTKNSMNLVISTIGVFVHKTKKNFATSNTRHVAQLERACMHDSSHVKVLLCYNFKLNSR